MTSQGLQPAAPADLRAQLVALVAASNPDYTANLPGSLIEDIASTDTYALIVSDSFLVDLVNSVTPYGANAFILNQLAALYGVDPQPLTNTAVYVVFNGPPGYSIAEGFTVSDGTYQYICQDGGICGADGQSLPLYALATVGGAWPVGPNTVVQMITSVPEGVSLSCTNPVAGIPSTSGEPISVYRERCFTAGLAASTGMGRYLKTLLANVPGVQNRLIAVQPAELAQSNAPPAFNIIVGGGDPYQVAYAIWNAEFFTPGLAGADIIVSNISNDNPVVVTTEHNHNLASGDVEMITGSVGMGLVNNTPYSITVLSAKTFSIPLDGSGLGRYQYGGVVAPNPINNLVTITDYPDTYAIPYVIPPQELVNITLTWETSSPNYVSETAMAQAAIPSLVDYINNLPAGTTPINLNVLNSVFLDAVADILPGELIIDIVWNVSINGVGVFPALGTQVIWGDPFSYFYTTTANVQVVKG
jgi:hypothetical protein